MFSNEDYGFSAEFAKPVTLENSRATVTAGASETYYKITADKEGLLRLSGASSKYDAYIYGTRFLASQDVAEGDEVVVIVKAGVTVNFAVLGTDELVATHNFTVVDGEGANVEGAKVTVSDNAGKVIAEGTTNAQGVVALEYIPGSFNVVVAKDGYYFDLTDDTNRAGTSESKTEYEFKLRNDAFSVTLTVKSGDKVFPNAKLTFITSFDQKVVKTATTDANGQVTVDLYIPASGQLEYTVDLDPEVEGNEDYYYSSSMCYFNQYYKPETATVDFKEYAVYTVTVKNKDGKGVKGVTVSLSQANYDWWDDVYTPGKTVASGVTNADGVVSIKCQEILVMSGMSGLGVSFSTVPEGYSLEFTAIADQSKDIEVT
ncbi:MAG: hypothetical protein K2L72_06265, partial [Clostridia bacterium]|nr:hypothetical protein [Clostridia bacterium]